MALCPTKFSSKEVAALALEEWITREFAGYGVAVRRRMIDPPIPGEPFMSMEDAKELVRRAVAECGDQMR